MYHLERIAFDLIDFCVFSEDNQEKHDDIYSHMLAMENFLESLTLIKIKVCDDKFDFNTQDMMILKIHLELSFQLRLLFSHNPVTSKNIQILLHFIIL